MAGRSSYGADSRQALSAVNAEAASSAALAKAEHQQQGVVDSPHLVERELSELLAKRARIDAADQLAHHSRPVIAHSYLRAKARGRQSTWTWTDDSRERNEIIRLYDHRVATSAPNVAATARQLDRVHLTGVAPGSYLGESGEGYVPPRSIVVRGTRP